MCGCITRVPIRTARPRSCTHARTHANTHAHTHARTHARTSSDEVVARVIATASGCKWERHAVTGERVSEGCVRTCVRACVARASARRARSINDVNATSTLGYSGHWAQRHSIGSNATAAAAALVRHSAAAAALCRAVCRCASPLPPQPAHPQAARAAAAQASRVPVGGSSPVCSRRTRCWHGGKARLAVDWERYVEYRNAAGASALEPSRVLRCY